VPAQVATVQPDEDGSLADGVVVETRLVARLLGLPLLRVNGVVLLAPGRVREPRSSIVRPDSTSPPDGHGHDVLRPGDRLAQAGRLIASTGNRLQQTRGG
jgi:hypothetical protein